MLVDPVLEQVERDLKLLKELRLTLRYCLETHVHADRIIGRSQLRSPLINELSQCDRPYHLVEAVRSPHRLVEPVRSPRINGLSQRVEAVRSALPSRRESPQSNDLIWLC